MKTMYAIPDVIAMAILVIGGEFGTGDERKAKLTELGYDASVVQEWVNILLPAYGGD